MALSATLYVFEIELADSDRNVYANFEVRAARHPSETAEYLLARMLAYCLEYTEGIAFSKGLSDPDEPAITVRDLTGALRAWIEVGAPEPARLHRASKAAPRVAVYAHRNAGLLAERYAAEHIHRSENLELYAFDSTWLAHVASRLSRRMRLSLTVAARHLYLTIGADDNSSAAVERIAITA
ncbi:MAG: YaeQ family protein [Proteobacteria bacterium]|nr:YaeQ family protein [Pseudomonadota bacterium]